MTTRRELTAAICPRYLAADRHGKKMILDEFIEVTGYHRKHAIRVPTARVSPRPERAAAQSIYEQAVQQALIVRWGASGPDLRQAAKALLPMLLELMERHGHLQVEGNVRIGLLDISAATNDLKLRSVRQEACGGRKRKRRPAAASASWFRFAPLQTGAK